MTSSSYASSSSIYRVKTFTSPYIQGKDVTYSALYPKNVNNTQTLLPIIFYLHGGGKDNTALKDLQTFFERCWIEKTLQPCLIVTPTATDTYYMDYYDKSELWTTFLTVSEKGSFRDEIKNEFKGILNLDFTRVAVTGASMGGFGSLRLALRAPNEFIACVSQEPGIPPAFTYHTIPRWYSRPNWDLFYGTPIDTKYFEEYNPATLARDNRKAILNSKLKIMLEVGMEDELGNMFGTEFIHRVLFDNGIKHEYAVRLHAQHIPVTTDRLIQCYNFIADSFKLNKRKLMPNSINMIPIDKVPEERRVGFHANELFGEIVRGSKL